MDAEQIINSTTYMTLSERDQNRAMAIADTLRSEHHVGAYDGSFDDALTDAVDILRELDALTLPAKDTHSPRPVSPSDTVDVPQSTGTNYTMTLREALVFQAAHFIQARPPERLSPTASALAEAAVDGVLDAMDFLGVSFVRESP